MEENKYCLSLPQRLILVNQYKILKRLTDNKDEQKDYDNLIEALESGFELHYQDCFNYMGESDMTIEECREVLDILEMFRGIIYSFEHIKKDSTQITEERIRFAGFDGNYETKQMLYCRYFVKDLDRYSEIQEICGDHFDYNSHCGMLSAYRQMLITWNLYRKQLDNPYMMTEEQIIDLIKPYHPMTF